MSTSNAYFLLNDLEEASTVHGVLYDAFKYIILYILYIIIYFGQVSLFFLAYLVLYNTDQSW